MGLAALSSAGCRDEANDAPAPPLALSSSATAAPTATAARVLTPADMAVKNLDKAIADLERALRAKPNPIVEQKLIGLLLQRASRIGRVSDFDRAVALGVRERDDETSAGLLAKARVLAAVHRFEEALAALAKAEKAGTPAEQLHGARASIMVALGRYDEALDHAAKATARLERTGNLVVEAGILGRMGKIAEAEAKFSEAEKAFRGVSPIELAWLHFERGSMWDRAGERDKAQGDYQRAVETLPQFAHAAGHLAAFLPDAEAEALLARVIETSDDPEYRAMLGAVKNRRKPGSGDALIEEAKKGYAALMQKHPLAFADHAGWFHLQIGDVDRAVEVAELNLKNRPSPEAFELAITALSAAGERDEACRVAERAMAFAYPSPGSKRAAAKAFEACGMKDRAADFAETPPADHGHVH